MPRFEPFPGIRFALDRVDIESVTAPPYDVIDDEQRAALAARDPHNIVSIDLPRGGDDPYAAAAHQLRTWLADGILVTDAPSFYVYRMDYTDEAGLARHTLGVFGALELSAPGEGDILPHEHTTPKAKSDRTNLLRATAANLSAVWGLSPAAGLSALLETADAPAASWTDDDGVTHSFWVVSDADRLEKISATVGAAPVVIADGHHRYETSLAYRDERRGAAGGEGGAYDSVLTFVVELIDDQLTVQPIHRLVTGLPDDTEVHRLFNRYFDFAPAPWADAGIVETMRHQGCLVLIEPDQTSFLLPRPGLFDGFADLDSVRLDAVLRAFPEHDLRFQHGVANVRTAVERGDAQFGVLLRPATVKQILAIAKGGDRMPPKTTFFYPKLKTGIVLRALG